MIKMIERMLERFLGASSYTKGVVYLKLAKIVSKGPEEATLDFTQIEVVSGAYQPVPMLATNKIRKQVIPYEDEKIFSFEITYLNQNDDSHKAICNILEYAEQDIDFRIYMQEDDDFVKSITSVAPRYVTTIGTLLNTYNKDTFASLFPIFNLPIQGNGWNGEDGEILSATVAIDTGVFKISASTTGNVGSFDKGFLYILDESFKTIENSDDSEKIHNYYNTQPYGYMNIEKIWRTTVRFKLTTNYQSIAVGIQGKTETYKKVFTTSSSYLTVLENNGIAAELVTSGVFHTKTVLISEMTSETMTSIEPNLIVCEYGSYDAPNSTAMEWHVDYVGWDYYTGNKGDTVEIFGPHGNVAKYESVKTIILSEILYNLRVASMQRFVETAYLSGLNLLSKDFGIYLKRTFTQSVVRALTRLFSSFVVPTQEVINTSLTSIVKLVDPNATVNAYGEFSDSYYKMIVDYFISGTSVTTDALEILVLFANRYRPVPADLDINIIIDENMTDEIDLEDSVDVEVSTATLKFSSGTIMSSSTIMGGASVITLTLPDTYP